MATTIKNDSSNLQAAKANGTVIAQGSLTINGTAAIWDGSDDTGGNFEFISIQVKAAEGAYVSLDGSAATTTDFEVPNLWTATYSRGQFLLTSFKNISTAGTVIYQGMVA